MPSQPERASGVQTAGTRPPDSTRLHASTFEAVAVACVWRDRTRHGMPDFLRSLWHDEKMKYRPPILAGLALILLASAAFAQPDPGPEAPIEIRGVASFPGRQGGLRSAPRSDKSKTKVTDPRSLQNPEFRFLRFTPCKGAAAFQGEVDPSHELCRTEGLREIAVRSRPLRFVNRLGITHSSQH